MGELNPCIDPHGTLCDGRDSDHQIPPMDQGEGGDPNEPKSWPVWIRITVTPDLQSGSPTITGEAMWYDANSTLQHSITTSSEAWVDTDAAAITQIGRWGASFHDRGYYIDYFCAGDGSGSP